MDTRLHVARHADGRWYWAVIEDLAADQGRVVFRSVVTFDTMIDAQLDFVCHDHAPHDGDRKVRPKHEILDLLNQAIRQCRECDGVRLEWLLWRERDEAGCNWKPPAISPDRNRCADRILPVVQELQRTYNIPDEA